MTSTAEAISTQIEQTQPDMEFLRRSGFMLIDMHVHTRFSDSFSRVSKLLARASRLGIGMAVTDHNEIGGVLRAFEIKDRVPVIPGIEISTFEGPHVLVYFATIRALKSFYEKHVQPNKTTNPHTNTELTFAGLMAAARQYDCLVSVAHPFSLAYTHVPRGIERGYIDAALLDAVDAVEVLNGAVTRKRNRQAIDYAVQLDKSITGGSDSHSVFELGKIVTYARTGSIRGFLQAVREKTIFVAGTPVSQVMRVPSLAKSSRKHMVYFLPTLPQRYEQVIARPVRYRRPMLIERLQQIKAESIERLRHPFLARQSAPEEELAERPVCVRRGAGR